LYAKLGHSNSTRHVDIVLEIKVMDHHTFGCMMVWVNIFTLKQWWSCVQLNASTIAYNWKRKRNY